MSSLEETEKRMS